jgi:hypothetical protein
VGVLLSILKTWWKGLLHFSLYDLQLKFLEQKDPMNHLWLDISSTQDLFQAIVIRMDLVNGVPVTFMAECVHESWDS